MRQVQPSVRVLMCEPQLTQVIDQLWKSLYALVHLEHGRSRSRH